MESNSLMASIFNGYTIISIMIGAFLLVILVLFIMALRLQKKRKESGEWSEEEGKRKTPANYLPLGFIITIPLGIALDNITLGIALGPAFGLLIGVIVTAGKKGNHLPVKRDLTTEELKLKKLGQLLLFLLILLGIGLYLVTYILTK